MAKNERLTNEARRKQLLDGAICIIKRDGWDAVTRDAVAMECNVAVGTVNFTYKRIDALRDAVYEYAVENYTDSDMLKVIAAGLVKQNPIIMNAPTNIKMLALNEMM